MTRTSWLRGAWLVARAELLAMVLGFRVIFLAVLYGGTMAATFALVLSIFRAAKEQITKELGATSGLMDPKTLLDAFIQSDKFQTWIDTEVMTMARAAGGEAETLVLAMRAGDLPWPAALGLLVTATTLPPLLLLISYDRISTDLGTGYVRYLFQRVHRSAYLAGKLAGQWLIAVLVMLLASFVLLAIGFGVNELDVAALLPHLPAVWLGMSLVLLAYLSFFTIFATAFTRPFVVLLVAGFAHFLVGTFGLFSRFGEVWMGRFDVRISLLQGSAVLLVFAHVLVFTGISFYILRSRDV